MDEYNQKHVLQQLAEGGKNWGPQSLLRAFTRPHKRKTPANNGSRNVIFKTHTMTNPRAGIEEQSFPIYEFACPTPIRKGIVVSISGYKGDPLHPLELGYLTKLRGAGFAVLAIPIEDPGRKVITLEGSINRAVQLISSPDSPLRKYDELPRVYLGHSAGAQVMQSALNRLDDRHIQEDMMAIYMAMFLGPANASVHHPVKKWLYEKFHAQLHPNTPTGDAVLDQLYYYLDGIGDRLGVQTDNPTHSQATQLASEGFDLGVVARRVAAYGGIQQASRIKSLMVISTNDGFACHKMQADNADQIGAEIMNVQAEHNPAMNPDVLQKIIAKIDEKLGRYYPSTTIKHKIFLEEGKKQNLAPHPAQTTTPETETSTLMPAFLGQELA